MKQIFSIKEPTNNITKPSELFKRIKEIEINYEQENFLVFYLNTKNEIKGSDILFKGGINESLVCPNILFRSALKNCAERIIITHNHPSGNLEPSPEDRDVYKRLKNLGRELNLKVLDSIIFNKKEFYSLEDSE